MTISIIIVNYNTYLFTKRCINSVLSSLDATPGITGEVLVVDNGSSDGSGERMEEDYRTEDRVRVLQIPKSGGFAAATNIGLKEAAGDYLLLLDSDTIVQNDTIGMTARFMQDHPEYSAMGCKVELPNGALDSSCKRNFPTLRSGIFHTLKLDRLFPRSKLFGDYNLTYLDEDTTAEVDCLSDAFMCVTRAAYEDVGGLDEDYYMYGEDIDWCYRLKEAGHKIVYHPETTITHFKDANWDEDENPQVSNTLYDSFLIFYEKHYLNKYGALTTAVVRTGTGILKGIEHLKNKLK